MDRYLRDRRIRMVATAGLLACLIVSIGISQGPGNAPAASADLRQFEVTSDARGLTVLPGSVAPGEHVAVTITYGGQLDDGLPGSIRRSYPLEVYYLVPKTMPTRSMEKKIFNYDQSTLDVKDGRVYVEFIVPDGVASMNLNFAVLMNGGSLLHETSERDWATVVDRNDEDTETFKLKVFVKGGDTKQ